MFYFSVYAMNAMAFAFFYNVIVPADLPERGAIFASINIWGFLKPALATRARWLVAGLWTSCMCWIYGEWGAVSALLAVPMMWLDLRVDGLAVQKTAKEAGRTQSRMKMGGLMGAVLGSAGALFLLGHGADVSSVSAPIGLGIILLGAAAYLLAPATNGQSMGKSIVFPPAKVIVLALLYQVGQGVVKPAERAWLSWLGCDDAVQAEVMLANVILALAGAWLAGRSRLKRGTLALGIILAASNYGALALIGANAQGALPVYLLGTVVETWAAVKMFELFQLACRRDTSAAFQFGTVMALLNLGKAGGNKAEEFLLQSLGFEGVMWGAFIGSMLVLFPLTATRLPTPAQERGS